MGSWQPSKTKESELSMCDEGKLCDVYSTRVMHTTNRWLFVCDFFP